MVTREREHELVEAAAAGDERAFAELVGHESGRTTAVAWRLTRDAAVAAEITNEAFVRLHQALPTLRGTARVSTWLYRTVINLCHDRRRAERHAAVTVPIEEMPNVAAEDPRPDAMTEAVERSRLVDAAVQALPAPMRETVILRYVRGLDYEEIAAVQDCPVGTVASRIHRALRLLGTLLAQQGIREGSL